MIGHVEEAAWDHRGFVVFAELGDEGIDVAVFQAREGGGAEIGVGGCEGLPLVGGEEVCQEVAIGFDYGAGALSDRVEILEGDYA